MKRFISVGVIVAICMAGAVITQPAYADEDSLTISSFDIEYHLSRDGDGRSVLKTVERITAEFPNFDQNHGLERILYRTYDDHSTGLSVDSVRDSDGNRLQYSEQVSGDVTVLRIGDTDRYVRGTHTYEITYTQRDVTKFFEDAGRDEWYWDTNGTQWRVPIQRLDIRIDIDQSIRPLLTGDNACYQGVQGSTNVCDIASEPNGEYLVSSSNLLPGENVSVAFGFKPKTFQSYQPSLFEKLLSVWAVLTAATFVVAIGVLVWLGVRFMRYSNRSKELGTIVPEYLPPKDTSVKVSASIVGSSRMVFAAQLIDLAVRHYVRIVETREKSLFRSAEYDIEIVRDIDTLLDEEREFLTDIYSGKPSIGQKIQLSTLRNNFTYRAAIMDDQSNVENLIRKPYGLREKNTYYQMKFYRTAGVVGLVSLLLLSIPLCVAALTALIMGANLRVLTDKGLALRRYLKGLKLYISVAETERLRILQSVDGAEKTTDDAAVGGDPAKLVYLYERVLPYAILFGQEKSWNSQLAKYYEQTALRPDWFVTNQAFSAVYFASAISSFSSASVYAASSSSSSGGSGGGGFSGGGGGGGGGGGW